VRRSSSLFHYTQVHYDYFFGNALIWAYPPYMRIFLKPTNETERLGFLKYLAILDTPCELVLDRIVFTAAQLFEVPISTLTLVDKDRQWFKAGVGLRISQTPRDIAFCAHTILSPEGLIVENASCDPRFSDNPLVIGEPKVRFYAGIPLVAAGGFHLGSLCVIDIVPRSPSVTQILALRQLAAKATKIICDEDRVRERRRSLR
jgi:hypothetical protein